MSVRNQDGYCDVSSKCQPESATTFCISVKSAIRPVRSGNQVCRVCATRCWHESFSFDDVSGHKTRDISPQGKREIRRIRTLARSQEEHLDRPRPRDAGRAQSLEPSPVGCRGSVDSTITAAGRCNKMAIIGGWISSPYGPYCDRSRMGILETLPFRSGFA
jgi:hypothetical protein